MDLAMDINFLVHLNEEMEFRIYQRNVLIWLNGHLSKSCPISWKLEC